MFDFVCNHMSAKVNGLKTIYNSSRFEDFIAVDPQTDPALSPVRVHYRY